MVHPCHHKKLHTPAAKLSLRESSAEDERAVLRSVQRNLIKRLRRVGISKKDIAGINSASYGINLPGQSDVDIAISSKDHSRIKEKIRKAGLRFETKAKGSNLVLKSRLGNVGVDLQLRHPKEVSYQKKAHTRRSSPRLTKEHRERLRKLKQDALSKGKASYKKTKEKIWQDLGLVPRGDWSSVRRIKEDKDLYKRSVASAALLGGIGAGVGVNTALLHMLGKKLRGKKIGGWKGARSLLKQHAKVLGTTGAALGGIGGAALDPRSSSAQKLKNHPSVAWALGGGVAGSFGPSLLALGNVRSFGSGFLQGIRGRRIGNTR